MLLPASPNVRAATSVERFTRYGRGDSSLGEISMEKRSASARRPFGVNATALANLVLGGLPDLRAATAGSGTVPLLVQRGEARVFVPMRLG